MLLYKIPKINKKNIFSYCTKVDNIYYFSLRNSIYTQYKTESINYYEIDKKKNKQLFNKATISHNPYLFLIDNKLILVSGTTLYNKNHIVIKNCKYIEGIYISEIKDFKLKDEPKLIIPKKYGEKNECCCFDSQPAVLKKDDLYYLYIRYNPKPQVRKQQLFRSKNLYEWEDNSVLINIINNNDINIYTVIVSIIDNKFYAVFKTYNEKLKGGLEKYNQMRFLFLSSNDGIGFTIINDIGSCKDIKGNPIANSLIKEGSDFYCEFITLDGEINKLKIFK